MENKVEQVVFLSETKKLFAENKPDNQQVGRPPLFTLRTSSGEYSLKDAGKLLYSRNPFYIISALLVLYGQTLILNTHDYTINTWIPVFVLGGYTLLLTMTALFIVKKGEVWDDAQSILGVILVLLLVISVSFDGETMDSLGKGVACLGGGLIFSLGILEVLRRGLGIRLSRNFIVGGYTILGLFFVYPLIVSQLILRNPDSHEPALWSILLFPVVMGLALFLWLPAAWQGRKLGRDNGTPWRNPRFPWSIGVIIGLGILARTFLLTLSYQGGGGEGGFGNMNVGFGIYMLIPPLLCALILVVEYARATGNAGLVKDLLAMPIILIILGVVSGTSRMHNAEYRQFTQLIFSNNFQPWMTGIAAALVFYAYAWIRKLRNADLWLAAMIVFTMMIIPREAIWNQWGYCGGGTGILLAVYLLNRNIWRWLMLCGGAVISAAIIFGGYELIFPVVIHAVVVSIMLAGMLEKPGWLGAVFRTAGAVMWLGMYIAALIILPSTDYPLYPVYAYLIAMCVSGTVYCYFCKGKFIRRIMYLFPLSGIVTLIASGNCLYLGNKIAQVIFGAVLTFAGAFGISMHKARKRIVK